MAKSLYKKYLCHSNTHEVANLQVYKVIFTIHTLILSELEE